MAGKITVDGVSKRFGAVAAVDQASISIQAGEVLALLGPSGCGKTTLLRLIAGFERPEEGSITLDDTTLTGAGAWVPPERRRIGMVFQDYALFPHLTVDENVGFGLGREGRRQRVPMLLALVDLCGLGGRYPHELSGGQQQRVALARALAPAPAAVLLDEPWSNVDPLLRGPLRDEVITLLRRLSVTTVLVTHDREEAFGVADRIALMRDGALVQTGQPEQLYYAPSCRWSAEFVGAGNLITGTVADGQLGTPLGSFPCTAAVGQAEALIRPELLVLRPDPDGPGQIVAREFRGHDVMYRVALDGIELVAQRPSNESVPLGARVAVDLLDGPVPVLVAEHA